MPASGDGHAAAYHAVGRDPSLVELVDLQQSFVDIHAQLSPLAHHTHAESDSTRLARRSLAQAGRSLTAIHISAATAVQGHCPIVSELSAVDDSIDTHDDRSHRHDRQWGRQSGQSPPSTGLPT